jgi:ArsR family metal-binding transcriptional regulator
MLLRDGDEYKAGGISMKMKRTSENGQKLIQSFSLELVEPACVPGADRWNAKAQLDEDISQVLPYLNAELQDADYDHRAKVLIWKDQGRSYAFRPYEMSSAPVEDREEGYRVIERLVALVNNVWERRHDIEPNVDRRTCPNVLALYKLLPGTNCRQCGYSSCMAYAADLREGRAELSRCPELSQQAFLANKDELCSLLERVA